MSREIARDYDALSSSIFWESIEKFVEIFIKNKIIRRNNVFLK